MAMIWTALATLTFAASAVATSVTAAYLRCWLRPPRVSSIQWLFSVFFANLAVWTSGRFIYFVWFWSVASDDHTNDNIDDTKFNQFDRLGLQAVEWLRSHGTPMMSLVMCIGDTALFGVAICTFPIARELWLLVRNAMDAGAAKETLKVHTYRIIIHGLVAVFGFVEGSIAIVDGGYSHQTHGMKLFAYATQLTSLLFIAGSLMDLKCSGRKFEAVHGVFVQSPLYARLKRMMLVYAFGTCQFQLSSFILNFVSGTSDFLSTYSGISLVLYSMTGLALSITIGCSQTCVLDMCACMMPSNGENPIASARGELLDDDDYQTGIKPPEQPVFVYTDIESSSELWSKDGGRIMQQATDLHDNIMRTALNKFHGYEITTVGDSFQLAFATIAEAVNYCLHVQNVLLAAPWPKELHGLVPATEKVRNGHRLVFCGLRVRMGIHDTVESEGILVCRPHTVTGKMTYTGAPEVVANEVVDLGDGGQILVTQRVAQWIRENPDRLNRRCDVDFVGKYNIPQLDTRLDIYQVHSLQLLARKRHCAPELRRQEANLSLLSTNIYATMDSTMYEALRTNRAHSISQRPRFSIGDVAENV